MIDFLKDINSISPDIICIQETKANDVDAEKALEVFSDYYVFINHSKEKKGYSGTSIISKNKPINVINDIGITKHDIEGRVILAEFDEFNLINVYVPNSGQELRRIDYRSKWDKDFLNYCKILLQYELGIQKQCILLRYRCMYTNALQNRFMMLPNSPFYSQRCYAPFIFSYLYTL